MRGSQRSLSSSPPQKLYSMSHRRRARKRCDCLLACAALPLDDSSASSSNQRVEGRKNSLRSSCSTSTSKSKSCESFEPSGNLSAERASESALVAARRCLAEQASGGDLLRAGKPCALCACALTALKPLGVKSQCPKVARTNRRPCECAKFPVRDFPFFARVARWRGPF